MRLDSLFFLPREEEKGLFDLGYRRVTVEDKPLFDPYYDRMNEGWSSPMSFMAMIAWEKALTFYYKLVGKYAVFLGWDATNGHMTMLLLTARLLHRHHSALTKNIVLLFQPAEEGKCGARNMIEAGALKDPDVGRIYGMHLWPAVDKGKIGVRWGIQMAHSCEFDAIVHGKSAHGASPQLGIDAVVAAAQFIEMLQSAITRSVDPHQDAILTIGRISGGVARNVIADRVELNGTLRVLNREVYTQLMEVIHHMAEGVSLATRARFEIRELMQYPAVDNPRWLVEDFYSHMNMDDIVLVDPAMAAEDFACYQEIGRAHV